MQIIQVLQTIDWLREVGGSFIESLDAATSHTPKSFAGDPMLVALYEHARMSKTLRENPVATEVLHAFGLSMAFLHEGLILKTLGDYKSDRPEEDRPHRLRVAAIENFIRPWRQMISVVGPLQKLTIPAALAEGATREEILTVNIAEREHLDLKTLIKTLSQIEALYDTVERVHGADSQFPPLELVKIESGTSVRVDVKGLGKPIKEIKNLILETWTKHRHKRVDEIVDHNRAVASSIQLLEEIDQKAKKGSLSNEDANRFKRAVVSNTLGLFKNGALIEEIPRVEVVDNVKLLDSFGPKLLEAPAEESAPAQAAAPSPAPVPELKPRRRIKV